MRLMFVQWCVAIESETVVSHKQPHTHMYNTHTRIHTNTSRWHIRHTRCRRRCRCRRGRRHTQGGPLIQGIPHPKIILDDFPGGQSKAKLTN